MQAISNLRIRHGVAHRFYGESHDRERREFVGCFIKPFSFPFEGRLASLFAQNQLASWNGRLYALVYIFFMDGCPQYTSRRVNICMAYTLT